MTKESAQDFLDWLNQDSVFKEKVIGCQQQKELQDFLTSEGYTFTKEELKFILEEKTGHELKDEEIAQVAIGTGPPTTIVGAATP